MEKYIYDMFSGLQLNPGVSVSVKKAVQLISEIPSHPHILEIACRCGMQSIDLAHYFGGHIYSVNSHNDFLIELQEEVKRQGYTEVIECVNANVFKLDMGAQKFNLIWSTGGISLIGFKRSITEWKKYLCNFGYMALNEVSWLRDAQPDELFDFCKRENPEMTDVNNNLEIIKAAGYNVIDYFVISPETWWNEYYAPLDNRIKNIRYNYIENELAQEVFDYVQMEIDMYKKYSDYYGYVYYIMQMPC